MSLICMVVDGKYPNDIRVRKEAEALAEFGYKVLVVCPKYKGETTQETINNVKVFRLGTHYSFIKKGINDSFESLFSINLFFYFGLKKAFQNYDISILHVHDLPLASTGYLFKSNVKKLILDLHENFPEALKTWFLWRKGRLVRLKNFLLMNPARWSKKERKFCELYDEIICVVDEMKDKLIRNFNIDATKLHVVSNTESKLFNKNFKKFSSQNTIETNCFSITYVGGLGPHRGLDTAIKSMHLIKETIPYVKLYLIGKGSTDVEDYLKNLAIKEGVENYVQFEGYKPFDEIPAIMSNSKVNIIPHHSNDHTNNTIPHKLFQIMMSNSLLMVSSCAPLRRIVENYDAGVIFEAGNHIDFATKIIDIYNNSNDYNVHVKNARDAVIKKGENWEEESVKLMKLYSNFKVHND